MTISVRQISSDAAFDSTLSVTLPSAPIEGNLLVAYGMERSGGTAFTMNSTGWTLGVATYQSPGDSTYRKSSALWWKIAGAAESATVDITTNGGAPLGVGIVEFESDAGELASIAFAEAVATGSDTPASSYASGDTASVASTNTLLVGHCYTKVGPDTDLPYSDWSAGADVLTEFAEYDMGTSGVDMSWAWGTSTTSGTHSATATKDVGSTDAERGAITSLLVFDLGGATEPPNAGSGSGILHITGSGTGAAAAAGSGSGLLHVTGSGTGSAPVVPPASGSGGGIVGITGSGTGSAPTLSPNAGSGSGSVAILGSGTGSAPVAGSGSGVLHLTGSGSGSAPRSGTGSGTLALTGSGTGSTAHTGTGSGLLAITGSGAGNAPTLGVPTGSGSGLLHLTGSGTGSAPLVEGATGTGSGTLHLLGSGTGATRHYGTGTGLLALTGSGTGRDPSAATRDIRVIAVGAPTSALTTTSPARKIYGETEPTSALTTSAPGGAWTDTEPNL